MIKSNIEIDYNKLSRDYRVLPLNKIKKGFITEVETPPKEDIIYLYIDLNFSYQMIADLFNISKIPVIKWVECYNIKKSELMRKMCQKERYKRTMNERYGVNVPLQSVDIRKKFKDTMIKKYGSEHALNNEQLKRKSFETNRRNHGGSLFQTTEEAKIKYKKTCLEKYGVDNVFQLEDIKEKSRITCVNKYGCEIYSKSKMFKNTMRNMFEKTDLKIRIWNTKKKNKTCNTSSNEVIIYNKLSNRFKDVKWHYMSLEYPFECDFYIPELDLYIEYQGFWTHGKEPYIGSDEQIQIVNAWKLKNTPQYNKAIQTWTINDVKKRKITLQNKLNYVEFFSMKQFYDWYESI